MYTPGDLVIVTIDDEQKYAEVLGVNPEDEVEVSFLKQTKKQEGRICEFVADDEWETVSPQNITKQRKCAPIIYQHRC